MVYTPLNPNTDQLKRGDFFYGDLNLKNTSTPNKEKDLWYSDNYSKHPTTDQQYRRLVWALSH